MNDWEMKPTGAKSMNIRLFALFCALLALSTANAQPKVSLDSIYELYKSKQSSLVKTQTLQVKMELVFHNQQNFPVKQQHQGYFVENKSSVFLQQMTSIISAHYLGSKYKEFATEVISVDSFVRLRVTAASEQQLLYLRNQPNLYDPINKPARTELDHVGSYNFTVEIDP